MFAPLLLALAQGKVAVRMYAEAYCTDCVAALLGPVNETFHAPEVWAGVDFELVPYGNAFQLIDECNLTSPYWQRKCYLDHCVDPSAPRPADCFTRPIVCQDGPEECWRNTVEACVIDHTGGDPAAYLPFVWCYIQTGHPTSLAGEGGDAYMQQCAAATGLDAAAIMSCASSAKGRSLINTAAERTADLGPARSFVPYFVVNGHPLPSNNTDLLDVVCGEWEGRKPRGCR